MSDELKTKINWSIFVLAPILLFMFIMSIVKFRKRYLIRTNKKKDK